MPARAYPIVCIAMKRIAPGMRATQKARLRVSSRSDVAIVQPPVSLRRRHRAPPATDTAGHRIGGSAGECEPAGWGDVAQVEPTKPALTHLNLVRSRPS